MSAAHRSLARLPREIFENLIVVRNNNATTNKMLLLSSAQEKAEEEQQEEDYNDYNEEDFNGDIASDHRIDAAILLRQAISQKLKAIPPSKQMPHRRKSLRQQAAAAAAATAVGASVASDSNTAVVGTTTITTTTNSNNNAATTLFESVQTVGPLLFMSKTALLRALDPLLTYGTFFHSFILCRWCSFFLPCLDWRI
jgi:hypothetical protein